MAPRKQTRAPELLALLGSYRLALESAFRSEGTIESYALTLRTFDRFLTAHALTKDIEKISATEIRSFLVAVLQGCTVDGCECGVRKTKPGNAHKHFRNLRAYFSWLGKEGERTKPHPMTNMAEPNVPEEPKEVFSDDELTRLLKTASGKAFADVRDTAIMRILIDTGMRANSIAGLQYRDDPAASDVDLSQKQLRIRKKGGNVIWVPIGKKAAQALDRYLRQRARHGHSVLPHLWLGPKGQFTQSGINQMVERRGKLAGVADCYPHRFRHTFADDWYEAGGSVQDLMRIGGWESVQMATHYGKSAAGRRAFAAHARLSPGDRI